MPDLAAPPISAAEVLAGLDKPVKELPPKLLYDARGSDLFERICELAAYYPTRTEIGIMDRHIDDIARHVGPSCLLIEFGSGSGIKTRFLLEHLERPAAYVPIDVSAAALRQSAAAIDRRHPQLEVLPVCADYTRPFALPRPRQQPARTVIYFPGSTIGNYHPEAAEQFLSRLARLAGSRGGLLIGVDLRKDPALLHRAYNDTEGLTAEFNRNLLYRLNRELDGDFDPDLFAHYAFYNPRCGRIEMHLVSRHRQRVTLADATVEFDEGESIWTESSYKYTLPGFADLAARAGFAVEKVWTDARRWFSVQFLSVARSGLSCRVSRSASPGCSAPGGGSPAR